MSTDKKAEKLKNAISQHLTTIQQVKIIRQHLSDKKITLEQSLELLKSIK
jgi:hypothetical protein